LREKTGKEYGKLIQKLLAIAVLETGVERLVERSIQGIDLDVRIAGRRYAFEVKTCEADEIRLGAKDSKGLERQIAEGAAPYVAVLGSGLLDEWNFVRYHPGELPSGKKLSSFRLRPYRDRELERRVRDAFEQVVERHTKTAIYERQPGLDKILEGYPARKLA
jgi:hypothetical protein